MRTIFPQTHIAVVAHRGLAVGVPENSLCAFRAAIDAGADVIECDVRASSDGVAVFAHDETLERTFGDSRAVHECTYGELTMLGDSPDVSVAGLQDALRAFPDARFSIDIKSSDAIAPTVQTITRAGANSRVAITSFSGKRRLTALRQLPGASTVASMDVALGAIIPSWLGLPWLARILSRRVPVLHLPVSVGRIDTTTKRMIRNFHRAGLVVHYWTINDVDEVSRLVERGADGIVTDRCDVVALHIRQNMNFFRED